MHIFTFDASDGKMFLWRRNTEANSDEVAKKAKESFFWDDHPPSPSTVTAIFSTSHSPESERWPWVSLRLEKRSCKTLKKLVIQCFGKVHHNQCSMIAARVASIPTYSTYSTQWLGMTTPALPSRNNKEEGLAGAKTVQKGVPDLVPAWISGNQPQDILVEAGV